MTDVAEPDDLPRARSVRERWPGLVWAIPLSALILVTVLAIHAFLNRGISVVVTFDTVTGVRIGDTKVVYQGYEVGHVTKIDVEQPTRRVALTITLDRRAKPILRTGTLFWLVGEKPDLGNISSVKGAIAGPSIGLAPSFDGEPTRYFRGLSEEPAVLPGTPGTYYLLTAEQIGAIKPRATIRFRGQVIGKVAATAFHYPDGFRVRIFIDKPYDRLIRPDTLFWQASALDVSFASGSLQAKTVDPSALVDGGINIDADATSALPPSPPNASLTLYKSRDEAEAGPPGPIFSYAMTLPGTGGDLTPGAPVSLIGFRIGSVRSKRPCRDDLAGLPAACVTVGIASSRVAALTDIAPATSGEDRAAADRSMNALLARGYRAELVQQPPLIGRSGIALVRNGAGRPASLLAGRPPGVPVLTGGGDPVRQLQEILAKVDRVPIEKIGDDVAAAARRLRALVSSPKVGESLDHLHDSLANVDQITSQAKPQVGPLLADLRSAAAQANAAAGAARAAIAGGGESAGLPAAIQQLTDAASSIRALADLLDRHPEALIRGKRPARSKVKKAR